MTPDARAEPLEPILPTLTPFPGIQILDPLDLLTEADRAVMQEALADLVRVQRLARRDTADVRLL